MPHSTTHERKGGLRGHDKERALVDQGDDHGMMQGERDQSRDRAEDNPGQRAQKDAAQAQVQSPGEPASGE